MLAAPSPHRPDTSSPYANPILGKLRSRRCVEDVHHQKLSASGDRAVWYKVEKADVGGTEDGAQKLLQAVSACFHAEQIPPSDSRVLKGLETDKRFTLAFNFPAEQSERVNQTIQKINLASRGLQKAAQRELA